MTNDKKIIINQRSIKRGNYVSNLDFMKFRYVM